MEKIYIVGNPNSGKTSLFNKITKSDEHIGNYSGVTVDCKEKVIGYENQNYSICDLPGIYSLSPSSLEEEVACKTLLNQKAKQDTYILNLCDKKSIKRALVLTLELIEAGFKVAMLINIMDKQQIQKSITKKIQNTLGINVFAVNVKKEIDFSLIFDTNNYKIGNRLKYLSKYSFKNFDNLKIIKICEQDDFALKYFSIKKEEKKQIENFLKDNNLNLDTILNDRLEVIDFICNDMDFEVQKQRKLDSIILNKYMAFPIFLAVMLCIFYVTFSSLGAFLTDFLDKLINVQLFNVIQNALNNIGTNVIFNDFVLNALIGGAGMLICFLPQIVLLFIFISILENSGYLPRLAFLLDDIFEKFGLSGKSLFTFIMSFGCSTTAMLMAKNLDNKKMKIKTMMLSQYMSCSAKLPIFTTLCSAFFTNNVLLIFCVYLIGILISLILALTLQNSKLRTYSNSFILEMPSYFGLNVKHILYVAYKNSKEFLIRVGGIVLLFMCVVWLLQNFSTTFTFTTNRDQTILYFLGNLIAPIFAPLGFGNYGACVALLVGLVAKELVVSTLSMLNFNESNPLPLVISLALPTSVAYFNDASALSFIVFVLLYSPCISSMSVMKKEIGTKYMLFAIFMQFIFAYIISLITYTFASLFNSAIFSIIVIFTILTFILILCMKNDKCVNCNKISCKYCKKL